MRESEPAWTHLHGQPFMLLILGLGPSFYAHKSSMRKQRGLKQSVGLKAHHWISLKESYIKVAPSAPNVAAECP